ncbi:TssN family type VI secretion system protein [Chitinophaga sp. Cy-1792]|uniref:TssN family type VI secretion system protein n=1 Tax=Chitinophaga sp. Cy-1792 TaxID=2608339 RepID=UPI00141F1FB5|nr:TssN family type VI secretion system protein [Chitinophaga sp. Cy-1792]NIG53732.1 hypothetical protein [Chitinophaga sp. Cy-1792]
MLTLIAVGIVCALLIVQLLKLTGIRLSVLIVLFLISGLILTGGSVIYMQYSRVEQIAFYLLHECIWVMVGLCNLYILQYISKERVYSWWKMIVFTCLLPLGYGALLLLFNYYRKEYAISYYPLVTVICWPFIILFTSWMTAAGMSIPVEIYRTWVYPQEMQVPEMKEDELKDVLVIGLKLTKAKDDPVVTYMRARAPGKIALGVFFFHFINDYNDRHPETPVQWQTNNRPDEWLFYIRHRWFRYCTILDPALPVYRNSIKENTIIYCRRI